MHREHNKHNFHAHLLTDKLCSYLLLILGYFSKTFASLNNKVYNKQINIV